LRPRRLREYLSPGLLALALALFAIVIGFQLLAHDFSLAWSGRVVQKALVIVVSNLALVAVGLYQLYGRKLNPYQASKDRVRQIRAQLTSLLLLSCALSMFFIWQLAGDALDLHYLDAPVMSLYFQMIVALSIGFMLHSVRFEDIDFEVYAGKARLEENGNV
jgi:hypothetical protein